jgi:multiple sugar transport system substrate-binding protein
MRFTRRDGLRVGMGAVAAAGLWRPGEGRAAVGAADVQAPEFKPENGASLRVLRPSKFVQGDETLWLENTKKFTETTGVEVIVNSENWTDLRPKTAVAASVGTGPDIILAWQEDPHLYPGKTVLLNDLTDYLGRKYGGWFPVAEFYGKNDAGDWIAMPVGGSGSTMVYRQGWMNEAGVERYGEDFPGFLDMCKKLQASSRPAGLALGNAVGDSGWVDTILWGFGSALIDEQNNVIIDNPQTVEALEYAKELSATFVPGVFSWLDPSNNKAFLAGECSLTSNGISIYYAAKSSDDPAMKAMADDIQHGNYPVGPIGQPTQGALVINAMVMAYSKYPNAAKEYLRFMMEEEQYGAWQNASIGYWCHPLQAYDDLPVWTEDPKHGPYRDVMRRALPQSYKGRPSEAASAAEADMVVVNMFQQVCAGQMSPKDAMAEAQRRARRYFRT